MWLVEQPHWQRPPVQRHTGFGNDWLTSMDEILLPQSLGWWPQGVGWWWLLALLCLLLGGYGLARWRRWSANNYRRQARTQLRALESRLQHGDSKALRSVPQLIRQVALIAYPRRDVVPLQGRHWQVFLQRTAGRPVPPGFEGLAYTPERQPIALTPQQQQELLRWAHFWIMHHRRVECCEVVDDCV